MDVQQFEQAVLKLAFETDARITPASVAYYLGIPSREANRLLNTLLREGVLELDSDEDGNLYYKVPHQGHLATEHQDHLADALPAGTTSNEPRTQGASLGSGAGVDTGIEISGVRLVSPNDSDDETEAIKPRPPVHLLPPGQPTEPKRPSSSANGRVEARNQGFSTTGFIERGHDGGVSRHTFSGASTSTDGSLRSAPPPPSSRQEYGTSRAARRGAIRTDSVTAGSRPFDRDSGYAMASPGLDGQASSAQPAHPLADMLSGVTARGLQPDASLDRCGSSAMVMATKSRCEPRPLPEARPVVVSCADHVVDSPRHAAGSQGGQRFEPRWPDRGRPTPQGGALVVASASHVPATLEQPEHQPGMALLLSLILCGTGQIYNGEVSKGIMMMVLCFLLWFVLLGWVVHIWSIVDAVVVAERINRKHA